MIEAAIAVCVALGLLFGALFFVDAGLEWAYRRSPMSRARRALDALERVVLGARDR